MTFTNTLGWPCLVPVSDFITGTVAHKHNNGTPLVSHVAPRSDKTVTFDVAGHFVISWLLWVVFFSVWLRSGSGEKEAQEERMANNRGEENEALAFTTKAG